MEIKLTGDISLSALFDGFIALHQESPALAWGFFIFIVVAVLGSLITIYIAVFYRAKRRESIRNNLEGQNEHRS